MICAMSRPCENIPTDPAKMLENIKTNISYLHFTPEMGLALLICLGIVGLAILIENNKPFITRWIRENIEKPKRKYKPIEINLDEIGESFNYWYPRMLFVMGLASGFMLILTVLNP
jgi:hypothetical protein